MDDTIVAISTALGVGAISIIRVSGNNALKYVSNIFKEEDLTNVETHTIHYGHIYDNEKIIDEVLVMVMKGPKTFTMEDTVEINCHGGIATTNKVLELVLSQGVRLAEPGEFTKRAFLNGRIDLIEAEGVMDLINSKTDKARKLAMSQIEGKTSELIRGLREEIINILANIEVNIDFPEYEDAVVVTGNMLKKSIVNIKNKIREFINRSENSKIIKDGIKTVIIGRPNVGKSSLLNKLIDEDKAIVTDIEGTTRDIVEGNIVIDGILLNIIDTAGIRETKNVIEKIGVEKSLNLIDEADLIILVLNNNEKLTEEDIKLIDRIKNKKHIIYINKIDLEGNIERNKVKDNNVIEGSTIKEQGLDLLKNKIKEMFKIEEIEKGDFTYLSNARQIAILKEAMNSGEAVEKAINEAMPVDVIEIDLRHIWDLLGEIIGESYSDELIDQLFSQFCLGK